jgi:hypothetical protein
MPHLSAKPIARTCYAFMVVYICAHTIVRCIVKDRQVPHRRRNHLLSSAFYIGRSDGPVTLYLSRVPPTHSTDPHQTSNHRATQHSSITIAPDHPSPIWRTKPLQPWPNPNPPACTKAHQHLQRHQQQHPPQPKQQHSRPSTIKLSQTLPVLPRKKSTSKLSMMR